LIVSVGYTDDANSGSTARRNKRLASEEEENVIEIDGDEGQWREEKLVEESETLPLVLPAKAEEGEEAHGEALKWAPVKEAMQKKKEIYVAQRTIAIMLFFQ
jgi:hypothetical protein